MIERGWTAKVRQVMLFIEHRPPFPLTSFNNFINHKTDNMKRIVDQHASCNNQFNNALPFVLMGLISIQTLSAAAQSGTAGINAATNEVKSYFAVGTTLMYAIGAIVGLVGAVKVYNKWNSGDQDTGKIAAAWFGSCIFLVVVATVLRGFFGV